MLDANARASKGPEGVESHSEGPDAPPAYIPPNESVEPLTGRGPAPRVKRFNPRTVGILAAATAAVAIAAFWTSLNRDPPSKKTADSQAEATVAVPMSADVITHLAGSYDDVPQLGRPMPGDIGVMAMGRPALVNGTSFPPPGPMPTSYAGPAVGGVAAMSEEAKLAARARDGGFGFGGGTSGAATASDVSDHWPGYGITPPPGMTGAAPHGDRDADNRQDDKEQFLNRDRAGHWDLKDRPHNPTSAFTLFAGTVLPGVLITGINSDLPGQIEGQIAQNVYDTVSGRYLILPQGTKLLGSYDSRVTYGQSRVLVVWTRIIRPDGSNLDLEGMPGTDLSGYAGVTGKVDRHLAKILGAVVLGSVIQAGTSAGTSYSDPSFSDRARQGAGQGVNEATQQIVRKELQLQPTIMVRPGERFAVFTTQDIVIPPYEG
jgi:type IV secretion system protein VirB10